MEKLATARNVIEAARLAAKERVAAETQDVLLLQQAHQRSRIPHQIKSFTTTAMQIPARRCVTSTNVTDLPPNDAQTSCTLSCIHYSVPYPHVRPMEIPTPPPPMPAHLITPALSYNGSEGLNHREKPSFAVGESMSLFPYLEKSGMWPVSASSQETLEVQPLDTDRFKHHGAGAPSMALLHSVDGDMATEEYSSLHSQKYGSQSPPILSDQGIVKPLTKSYTQADVQTFRHHYDALGQLVSASTSAATTPAVQDHWVTKLIESGHCDPRTYQYFSPKSKELLGSIRAFRLGLQQLEQHRRRRNTELNRDPADFDHLQWHQSLPQGYQSPFPSM